MPAQPQETPESQGTVDSLGYIFDAAIEKVNPQQKDKMPGIVMGHIAPVTVGKSMHIFPEGYAQEGKTDVFTTTPVTRIERMSDGSMWISTRSGSVYRITGTVVPDPKTEALHGTTALAQRIRTLLGPLWK
ncbi:hypothetical protein GX553_03545 [Candidatus Peribacteria bacterium]|nr:hypothetical protein [Candidatus Peribacteria bacterium]